jgi:hypothetical protein
MPKFTSYSLFVFFLLSISCGYLWRVYIVNVKYIIWPQLIPEDLYTLRVGPDSIQETCDTNAFSHVKTVHNVHDIVKARKIVITTGAPVVFKQFTLNQDKKIEELLEIEGDTMVDFTDMELETFGNLFFPGAKKLGRINDTLKNALQSAQEGKTLFASFTSFLTEKSIPVVAGNITDKGIGFMLDSNFVSNFPNDLVSTEFHAAAAVRYVLHDVHK